MNAHNLPARPFRIADAIQEYEAKRFGGTVEMEGANGVLEVVSEHKGIDAEIAEHEAHYARLNHAFTVGGRYVGRPYDHYHSPSLSKRRVEALLLESAWRLAYDKLGVDEIASAQDKKRIETILADPPEFNRDNIVEVLGDYIRDPRFHILKGLAECFADLDPIFKSHSKIKIGVKALPKRIIVANVVGDYGIHNYGADKLRDIIQSIDTYDGEPRISRARFSDLLSSARDKGEECYRDLRLRIFGNGNAHLFFGPDALLSVNRALAEFYGEVLPDVPEENPEKRESTEVSKDLQFYPTPEKVIKTIIDRNFGLRDGGKGYKLLEPSCGDGRIMRALQEEFPELQMLGVEVDFGRAEAAKSKGFRVLRANFLDTPPQAVFDRVLMNPPFYGLHWKKHLKHALKFLKPNDHGDRWSPKSNLIAILPATAFYDGHLDEFIGEWKDLPVGSFSESGTNVPTGYFMTYGEMR